MQWWRISTFRSPFGGKLRFFEMFREDFFLEAYRVPPWLHKPVNLWSSSWYHHKNHSPKHTCSFSVVHKICFQLGERMIIHSAGSVEFIVLVIVLCRRRLASTCSFENKKDWKLSLFSWTLSSCSHLWIYVCFDVDIFRFVYSFQFVHYLRRKIQSLFR